MADLFNGALVRRIKIAQTVNLIIKEFDAQRHVFLNGKNVNDTAAHGICQRLVDPVGMLISAFAQFLLQLCSDHGLADLQINDMAFKV